MPPSVPPADRVRVLTWHVHGSYLLYLAQCGHDIFLPVRAERDEGYAGRSASFPWPDNVHEVDVADLPGLELDVVLCQSRRNYMEDRHEILAPAQQELPVVYLEHDPPREHPTDTRHVVDDPAALIVHVTHFNRLMWDNGRTPSVVIEHGVFVPQTVRYTGELERGVVVINGLPWRGRRLGLDLFLEARRHVPLDLVGMQSEEIGGLGEVSPRDLPRFIGSYRFLFNPIRYTSLGLAVLEAMTIGMPIVALATTELPAAVEDGVSGYTSTNSDVLIERMRRLLDDPALARRLGNGARQAATTRYGIDRFAREWHDLLVAVTSGSARGAAELYALGAAS